MRNAFQRSRLAQRALFIAACSAGCFPASALRAGNTWDGGGTTGQWSELANWNGNTAPTAGAALIFGGTLQTASSNDLFPSGTSFGDITFSSGSAAFTLAGAAIALSGNVTNNSGSLQTLAFDINLGAAVRTFSNASGAGSIVLTGLLSGAGGVTHTGVNRTLTLSNAGNAYAGTTRVNTGGILAFSSIANVGQTSAIGAPATNGVNLLYIGGTLRYTGPSASSDRGYICSNGTIEVSDAGATLTLSGAQSDNDNTSIRTLTKTGAGTLTLSGVTGGFQLSLALVAQQGVLVAASTGTANFGRFSGAVVQSGGTLRLASSNNQVTGVVVDAGGTLDLVSSQNIGTLANSDAGGIVTTSTTGTKTLGVNNTTQNSDFAGVIENGAGALAVTKSGATTTLRLSGANTYSGATTVAAGTLLLTNGTGSATGTSAVTVAAGATIGGSGTAAGTLTLNGTLAPGLSTGVLTTGAQTWQSGADYRWEINHVQGSAGSAWDLVAIDGSLTLTATAATPIILRVRSLTAGNLAGPVPDFVDSSAYTWTVLTTSGGINGFTGDNIVLDLSGWTNPYAGVFTLEQSGNALVLRYRGDTAPVATVSAGASVYSEPATSTAGTVVVDPGLTVTDIGNSPLTRATVSLTGSFFPGEDRLVFTPDSTTLGDIVGGYDSNTGVLTLTSASGAPAAGWQAALRTVIYRNDSDAPTASVRTIAFAVDDSSNVGSPVTKSVTISATNDPPTVIVPGSQSIAETATLTFDATYANALTIADPDAGTGDLRLTLVASHGTLTLATTTRLTLLGGATGANEASVTVQGPLDRLQAALAGLRFRPTLGASGSGTLSVTLDDLGRSGSGGALTATATVPIVITPVAPTVTSVTADNPNGVYKPGDNIVIVVRFSLPVTLNATGGIPALALATAGGTRSALYTSGSGTTQLQFHYRVQAGDETPALDCSNEGALTLEGGAIQGTAGIAAGLRLPTPGSPLSLAGQKVLTLDGVGPQPRLIDGPAGGTYTAGATWDFLVTFSEPVVVDTVPNAPRVALTTSTSTLFAAYLSGSGTTMLRFRAIVGEGDHNLDGVVMASAIDLNGGTLRDSNGNPATLTLPPFPSVSGLRIDNLPRIESALVASGQVGQTFSYFVRGTRQPTAFALSPVPVGLAFTAATGELRGVPTVAGVTRINLAAGNALGLGPSSILELTVAPGAQTLAWSLPATASFGTEIALQGTASSALPVVFAVTAGPGLLTGTRLSFTGVGEVRVRATQTGDANYGPAAPVERAVTVLPAASQVTLGALTQTYDGSPRTITVTTEPAGLTTAVTYDGTDTAPVRPGVYAVTATVTDSRYQGQASGTLVVERSVQTLDFLPLVDRAVNAGPGLLTARASSGLPVVYTVVTGPAIIAGDTVSSLGTPGEVVVRAEQAGDDLYLPVEALRSFAFTPAPEVRPAGLVNFSARLPASAGEGTAIVGFVVAAPSARSLLLRGVGSGLRSLGVRGALERGELRLHADATLLSSNQGWDATADNREATATAASRVGAFSLLPNSGDTALVTSLTRGAHTLHLLPVSGSVHGVGLIEVYDLDTTSPAGRIVNMSARGMVGQGADVGIAGFVLGGAESQTVLVRAVGPGLHAFGLTGFIRQPVLQLYKGQTLHTENRGGWESAPRAAEITAAGTSSGAFPLSPRSPDAALLVTLPPGAYTAHTFDEGGATGIVLLELYVVTSL